MGCSSTNNKDDAGNNKTRYEHNNAKIEHEEELEKIKKFF